MGGGSDVVALTAAGSWPHVVVGMGALAGCLAVVGLALETQAHRPFWGMRSAPIGGALDLAHCLVALPSVRQLLESGQVPRWISLIATLGP